MVECAITGVPDEIRGQVVKATIVLAEAYRGQAGEALVRELQDHVKRITAPYKYPRVIEFVESLPKTISGKIRRKEIRSGDEGKESGRRPAERGTVRRARSLSLFAAAAPGPRRGILTEPYIAVLKKFPNFVL